MVYSAYFKGITMSSTFMENLNVVFEYRIPERYFFLSNFVELLYRIYENDDKKF